MKKGTPEEIKAYKLENYHKNKHKNKEQKALKKKLYKEANKERIREVARLYYEKQKATKTTYYDKNRQKVLDYAKAYRIKNKAILKIKDANKQRKRRTNLEFRLKENIRTRVRNSFSIGYTKKSKSFDILGCSYQEFRDYIQSKFEPWMNWENYGNWNGYSKESNQSWDLDHIIPVSIANSEAELVKLNHYSNFQPLCSYNNRHIKRDCL